MAEGTLGAVVGLGAVQLPGRENEGRAALSLAVVDVLKAYTVSEDFTLSGGGEKIRQDISHGIVRGGNRLLGSSPCDE